MPIAKNIKYLRKQNHMTQQDLATILGGMSATTINKWENKMISPPISKVRMIADVFQRDFSEICDIDIEKSELETLGGHPTEHEMQYVLKARALPKRERGMIRNLIDYTYGLLMEEQEE